MRLKSENNGSTTARSTPQQGQFLVARQGLFHGC